MNAQTERIAKTYDDLPYISGCFPQSAPEHLRAVAYLFGLDAPPLHQARVLDLGCAAGGNVIPFATRYPQATVVGVDLPAVQIEAGRRAIETIGLSNITLRQGSIADLDASLGQFDYIICHGVYSWVPDDVREAILRVASECLSPEGVAYISYNTYPGWKAKEVVRDAMMLRGGGRASQEEGLAYARGMIDFLHDTAQPGSLLEKIMDDNIQMVRHGDACYLNHEYLELCNSPCYFREFLAKAAHRGLSYLAEAEIASMFAGNHGRHTAELLLNECAGEQVVLEQLMDFINNRTFRETLLVHDKRADQIRYRLDPSRLVSLHLAGRYVPQPDNDGRWQEVHSGRAVATGPDTQQVIDALNEAWPATVAVEALVRRVASVSRQAAEEVESSVLKIVYSLIISNAVRFRLEPVIAPPRPIAYPEVPAVLRRLAELRVSGDVPLTLFNAWHECLVTLGPVEQKLLPLLDGGRDINALGEIIGRSVANDELHFQRDGKLLVQPEDIAAAIEENVRRSVQWFAEIATLAASSETAPAGKPAPKRRDRKAQ
ncbi:methyltransferase-like protein [Paraburkholderia sp. BL23I1N1]|uniref:methyltransferase regulatory domain-containing protein n=1 Tax=Paraburkholderia sp. BL23I1N1 TaxID=1938802 RepID=UPI000E76B516|nr:class I SAM-dependent methyltransferase [Paraburkholderia sp. BL23I1N1]RKE34933.1 methyltransferase-like protein [Paraburkholderia sp. BL23I1N1]